MKIRVTADGTISWTRKNGEPATVACALGRSGVGTKRGEGDGITPRGEHPLRRVFYRPDRLTEPTTEFVTRALRETDGWCDDPDHPAYNTLVSRPFAANHEEMWREDGVYDVVVETGYNDDPVVPGKGSAIFIHVARPGYEPTEGCVALAMNDLLDMLAACRPGDSLVIGDR